MNMAHEIVHSPNVAPLNDLATVQNLTCRYRRAGSPPDKLDLGLR